MKDREASIAEARAAIAANANRPMRPNGNARACRHFCGACISEDHEGQCGPGGRFKYCQGCRTEMYDREKT